MARQRRQDAQAASATPNGMNWMQLAALNLIEDHDAGIAVDAVKLAAARDILARAKLVWSAA